MADGANGAVILCRRIAGPMHDIEGSNAGRRLRASGVLLDRSSAEWRDGRAVCQEAKCVAGVVVIANQAQQQCDLLSVGLRWRVSEMY